MKFGKRINLAPQYAPVEIPPADEHQLPMGVFQNFSFFIHSSLQ